MNNSKNIVWINSLKAICIVAVFFVHCQLYYGCMFNGINRYVYPFYINAFFFVSGYLLFWKQLSEPKILEDRKLYMLTGGKSLVFNIIYRIIVP